MKKSFIMALALVLVLGIAIGGTVAWLTASTDPVTNTFTVGDINITLTETGANNNAKSYTTVPGSKYDKDPNVTVQSGSEACWLFVKVSEVNNTMTVGSETKKIVNYTIATGWTAVPDHAGYYYKEISADDMGKAIYVFTGEGESNLKNGFVTINENVTKGQITASDQPQIVITAAAVQKDNVADVNAAWAKLPSAFTDATTTNP